MYNSNDSIKSTLNIKDYWLWLHLLCLTIFLLWRRCVALAEISDCYVVNTNALAARQLVKDLLSLLGNLSNKGLLPTLYADPFLLASFPKQ